MNEITDMRFCIQCVDLTSGRVSTFLYFVHKPFVAVSPLFSGLGELFNWMDERDLTTGVLSDFKVYRKEQHHDTL